MFIKKNVKNRTWFIGHRNPKNIELFYSVPFRKSKKRSQLTIRKNKVRVDLNGRQINLLIKLIVEGLSKSV